MLAGRIQQRRTIFFGSGFGVLIALACLCVFFAPARISSAQSFTFGQGSSDQPMVFGKDLSGSLQGFSGGRLIFRPKKNGGAWQFARSSHQGSQTTVSVIGAPKSVSPLGSFAGLGKRPSVTLSLASEKPLTVSATGTAGDSLVLDLPRSFRPGLYRLSAALPGSSDPVQQDFAWGVLAVNPDKDRYRTGETADIAFGVLDALGNIVCDASLSLTLRAPDGAVRLFTTEDRSIQLTGTCGKKEAGFIDPDYRASAVLDQMGTYTYDVVAVTRSGTWTLSGELPVASDAPVIIARKAATRLWPAAPSPMTVSVLFSQDFSGSISDVVPEDFVLSGISAGGSEIKAADAEKRIVWQGSWKSGETAVFSYMYDAPDISPEFFVLGPVVLEGRKQSSQTELRQWQIANDASLYITGKLTQQNRVTPIGSKTIAASLNGAAAAGTATTDAGGQFTITGLDMSASTVVTLYVDGDAAVDAVTVMLGSDANMTGTVLIQDTLTIGNNASLAGNTVTNTDIDTADNNGDADITALIGSASSSAVQTVNGKFLFVTTGNTFVPGGSVRSGSGVTIDGTLSLGGNRLMAGGQLTVNGSLVSAGNGTVALEGPATAKRTAQDNTVASYSGSWGNGGVSAYYYLTTHYYGYSTGPIATYTFNVPPGMAYRVANTWMPDPNRASNIPYAIYDGSTLLYSTTVNQQAYPVGFSAFSAPNKWQYIGTGAFIINSGALKLVLGNAGYTPGQYIISDGTLIEEYSILKTNGSTLNAMNIQGGSWVHIDDLDINGTLTMTGGLLQSSLRATPATTSSSNIALGGSLYDRGGVLRNSSGTLLLDGTNQLLSGSSILWNVRKTVVAPDILSIGTANSPSIQGSVVLRGADCANPLTLRSTETGSLATLTMMPRIRSEDLKYVRARDIKAVGPLYCLTGCVNVSNNPGWLWYYKTITVDNTNAASALTDFPLYVGLRSDANIAANSRPDAYDLRFVESGNSGTTMDFEREKYWITSGSGSGDFWVRVPSITAAGQAAPTFNMYYGSGTTADHVNTGYVWDANYRAVYHMNDGDATTTFTDSSRYRANGTKKAVNEPTTTVAGKFGNALSFDGANDYISLGGITTQGYAAPVAPVTFEVWINTSDSSPQGIYDTAPGVANVWRNLGNSTGEVEWWNRSPAQAMGMASFINTWTFIAVQYYHNGYRKIDFTRNLTHLTSANGSTLTTRAWSTMRLGDINTNSSRYLGLMDEFRISNIKRSNAWLDFGYYNMSQTDNEINISSQQLQGNACSPSNSNFFYFLE